MILIIKISLINNIFNYTHPHSFSNAPQAVHQPPMRADPFEGTSAALKNGRDGDATERNKIEDRDDNGREEDDGD
jgi:hypothetical protein